MFGARRWLLPLVLSVVLPWPQGNASSDTIQCTTGEVAPTSVVGQFHVYRPGTKGVDITWRDLEFMWDASYTGGLSFDARSTLDRMAATLVTQTGRNPFGAGFSKIHLDYNYFSVLGPTYNTSNPLDSTAMALARPYSPGDSTYINADRSHVDYYLGPNGPSKWPSFYVEVYEDTSTGHPVNLENPQLTHVYASNSISGGGPAIGSHIDLTGTGWTDPDKVLAATFMHELGHTLNPGGPPGGFMMDEMFAQAAEAVCGRIPSNVLYEVPYTWPLLYPHSLTCAGCCDNPRDGIASNYFGRGLFTAYLAYNFRGADTSGTATGLNDDLLRRWSRRKVEIGPDDFTRHWSGLVGLLGDDSCGTCVGKNYFRQSGTALPQYDRAQLLLHNWRVANYVSRFDLPGTEGQYGFPPHFGFSPGTTLKAWQAFDGCNNDDVVSIPPVVTLTSANVTQEMNLRVKREFRGNWYPMSLKPTGAEYWVIRADTASLGTTPRDLVITISSDSVYRRGSASFPVDGRLMASIVGYTLRAPDAVESPQWQNPQWAQLALEPKWVNTDSLPAELRFVLPSFGVAYKAAVVIISLGDGPGRGLETTSSGWSGVGNSFELPYRMSLALRGAPNDTLPNPRGLHQDPLVVADHPAWSPTSDELAFTRVVAATGASRIYRQWLDGSPAVQLLSGTERQSYPDWSPRGDWVAYAQDSGTPGTQRDVWLFSVATGTAQRLTFQAGLATRPAFQPNGQGLAYAYFPTSGDRWELRRVDLAGSNDVALVAAAGASEIRSLRWSPDGLWIYFTRNDTLYAVSNTNGQVVAHPEMLTNVTSLDFHLSGTNRFAAEQTGIAGSLITPQRSPQVAFRRLVLRDVAATDTRGRFYRTGAEFYHPRWSPDGLRVAYSSNQNTGGADRDLFVGQVSYDRAPALVGVGDLLAYKARPFEFYVNASDPNGEALKYEAPSAFLPAGSSFNEQTRRFYWADPGPVCGEKYMVFRALDGSGGVASKVVKITTVIDSIGDLNAYLVGDTAIWLSWTAPGDYAGQGLGVEYELRYSEIPLDGGTFSLGARVMGMAAPASPGASESQVIGGLTPATTYYVAIRTKDAKGNWSLLSNVDQFTTTCCLGGGGQGTSAHEVRGGDMHRSAQASISRPGGTESSTGALAVEMGLEGGAPVWSIRQLQEDEILAHATGDSISVLLQAKDALGAWYDQARIMSRDATSRFAVRGLRRPGRIVFIGSYGLRQAWDSVELDGRSGAARLLTAQHSRLGDVKSGFEAEGVASLEVAAADTLALTYELLGQDSETAQDWFLLVGPPGSEVATPVRARPGVSEGRPLPTAFTLRQNHPNPFSGRTTIRFELPAETSVRLEVFDAQGRLVRTLAKSQFPPGFHALDWDERDAYGRQVGSGVYLYRIHAGAFRDQKKMVLLPR